MFVHGWKLNHAGSVGQPIRCRWKLRPRDKSLSQRAGSSNTPIIVKEHQWPTLWPRKLKTRRPARGTRSRSAKTHIKWRKRTVRLRISVGKNHACYTRTEKSPRSRREKSEFAGPQVPTGTNAQHRHRRAHRRRQDDDYRARAVLHRHDP